MTDTTITETTPAKYSRAFWIDLGDRAVSTASQSAIATLATGGLGILDVDVVTVLSIAGLATLLSILKAFAVRVKSVIE